VTHNPYSNDRANIGEPCQQVLGDKRLINVLRLLCSSGRSGVSFDFPGERDYVIQSGATDILLVDCELADAIPDATTDRQDIPGGPRLVIAAAQ
jgi:hypothetical protein